MYKNFGYIHLDISDHRGKRVKPGCDAERPWNSSTDLPSSLWGTASCHPLPSLLKSLHRHLPTPLHPRLQKILTESPPPARLDIQLPVISDDFKFQVWRKMFRALMPGIWRAFMFVTVWLTGRSLEKGAHCPLSLGLPSTLPHNLH